MGVLRASTFLLLGALAPGCVSVTPAPPPPGGGPASSTVEISGVDPCILKVSVTITQGTTASGPQEITLAGGSGSATMTGNLDWDQNVTVDVKLLQIDPRPECVERFDVATRYRLTARLKRRIANIYTVTFSALVVGEIDITGPQVTPDPEQRAQVSVIWTVEATCPCNQVRASQEIKGYIEFEAPDGTKSRKSARDLVLGQVVGIAPGTNPEVDAFRRGPGDPTTPDTSQTEFIPDIGDRKSVV